MSTRLLVALAVLALSGREVDARQAAVVGAWKLVSYVTETPDGTHTYPLGEKVRSGARLRDSLP